MPQVCQPDPFVYGGMTTLKSAFLYYPLLCQFKVGFAAPSVRRMPREPPRPRESARMEAHGETKHIKQNSHGPRLALAPPHAS